MLAPAHVGHLAMLRSLIRQNADEGSFDSGLIEPGRSYERVFDRPGDYAYHCTPHPFMTGHVIVEP